MFGIKTHLVRNRKHLDGSKANEKKIYLEWWQKKKNIGDCIAPVIYEKITDYYGLDRNLTTSKPIHLLTIGSLIAMAKFDAVVWGSGIHCMDTAKKLVKQSKYVKYDIRAVRGPVTDFLMKTAGYTTSGVYGDPAVLMPLFFKSFVQKKYPVSLILHVSQKENVPSCNIHCIDVETDDYMYFINEICASEIIISSSLHGIILAEAYGVPAVYLCEGLENEKIKFIDWYYSTNRYNIQMAHSVEEALDMEPMPLPELGDMQKALIDCFPKNIWGK